MRKLTMACCVSVLSASAALAQKPVAVHWNCAVPAPVNTLDPGDQPNHAFTIMQVKCNATKGEIAGIKQKSGMGTEFHEALGTADKFHGVYVETLANGDKISYTYTGTATTKAAGGLESGKNEWSASTGSGKFMGIKASGTCKAVGNPDGTASFDCTGTYTLPK